MATRQKDDSSSPQPDVLHLAAAVGEQRLEARARTARRCARAWRPLEVGGERWSQYSHGLCCAVCAHAFRRRDTVPTCGCPSSTIGLRRHRARSIHTCWRRTIALRSAAPDLECRAQRLAAPRYLPQSSFQEVKILGPRKLTCLSANLCFELFFPPRPPCCPPKIPCPEPYIPPPPKAAGALACDGAGLAFPPGTAAPLVVD